MVLDAGCGPSLTVGSILDKARMGKGKMRIIETIPELKRIERGGVLTIGNFDCVHLGHQEILAAAKQIAAERQTQLTAMTFEPHPAACGSGPVRWESQPECGQCALRCHRTRPFR